MTHLKLIHSQDKDAKALGKQLSQSDQSISDGAVAKLSGVPNSRPMTYGVIDLSVNQQNEIAGSAIWAASPLTDACIETLNKARQALDGRYSEGQCLALLRNIHDRMKIALEDHEDLIDILETDQ